MGVSALIALRDEAQLRPNDSVLVLGATGGLGQALVHLARDLGAGRVVAAGRNPARLDALTAGADSTLLLEADPSGLTAALDKAGGQVDIVVDLLWGPRRTAVPPPSTRPPCATASSASPASAPPPCPRPSSPPATGRSPSSPPAAPWTSRSSATPSPTSAPPGPPSPPPPEQN